MRIRLSKVRTTDNRPPAAGGRSPLERASVTRGGSMTGLDHLAKNTEETQRQHDSWVAGLSPATMEAAFKDLATPPSKEDFKTEWEWRKAVEWQKHRRAALMRAGYKMKGVVA